ncbi:MAG: methyltransferase domain-containing protein [Thiobacillus sp.]|jgi:SAM-dependent methyltransferase
MQNGQELADLYRIRFERDFLPRKRAIWRELCKGFLQGFIKPGATVVDVACGYGEFINNIKAGTKIAVDLNPDTKNHLSPDVEFHALSADDISAIGESRADVLFTSNFLEHLPDKKALNGFLEQVMSVLKPGGRFLILGPNLRYLPGEYWDFYDHHLGLTHLSLSEALELKGFRIEKCIDKFLPYTTQGALPTHPLLVKLYLMFPPAWRLLGKQFFIVATKPA